MIIGVGIDLVELSRIRNSLERFGHAFACRIMHEKELDALPDDPYSPVGIAHVAARFAAKEAAVKALGTGFSDGIGPRDICVTSLPSGKPVLKFDGKALERARELHVGKVHVSLSHSRDSAAAVVVLESE